MNKREAAEFLGTTVRSIESYVQKKKLRPEKVQGENGLEWRFDRAELEELKAARSTVSFAPVAALTPPPTARAITTGGKPDPLELLRQVVEGLARHRPGPGATTTTTGKVLLTREDLVNLGVPKGTLRRALASGALPSFGKRANLRVNAEDFDVWRLAEAGKKQLQEP